MILIAAIAVGALAAFAIFNYVQGIEDREAGDAQRHEVWKVEGVIGRGVTGREALDQGLLERAEIAEEFFPATAVQDPETIASKVAVAELAPGQVLVENMFVDPINSQITAARRIQTGRVAITISVDQIRGVAGLIVPGDFVNMMATPGENACGVTGADGAPVADTGGDALPSTQILCTPARMVYQEVQVLFVDRSPIALPGEQATAQGTAAAPANTGLLTLSVPPEAARIIASVTSEQWYLTLVPTDYVPATLPPFDPSALATTLPGEDAAVLTPYGPEGFTPEDTP